MKKEYISKALHYLYLIEDNEWYKNNEVGKCINYLQDNYIKEKQEERLTACLYVQGDWRYPNEKISYEVFIELIDNNWDNINDEWEIYDNEKKAKERIKDINNNLYNWDTLPLRK